MGIVTSDPRFLLRNYIAYFTREFYNNIVGRFIQQLSHFVGYNSNRRLDGTTSNK